jgi:hypothetical protein
VQHKEDEQKIFMELCINKETALNLKNTLETVKKAFEEYKATDSKTSNVAFLENWSRKLADYELILRKPIEDAKRREYFETAIEGRAALGGHMITVYTIEQTNENALGTTAALKFEQVYTIIMNQAILADKEWRKKNPKQAVSSNNKQRKAN